MASIKQIITGLVTGQGYSDESTPEDEVAKWTMELQSGERFLERFHTSSRRTVKAYIGERPALDAKVRLNLFYSNVVTLRAMLFSKLPKVSVDRRFSDPDDDVARVAAEIVKRVVENDLYDPEDTFEESCKEALNDRLIPGMGEVRLKYGMEEEDDPTLPPVVAEDGTETPATKKTDEWCDFVYTHWKDILWSPCRTKAEMRWKAYRSYMTKEEVAERFGEEVATAISFNSKGPEFGDKTDERQAQIRDTKQAEIWEIWDKEAKEVLWLCKSYSKILDKKPDPLELPEFWPGEAMMSNLTSDALIPKSDYAMVQDLYEEIDDLQTRISLLTEAAKCVGVYDQSAKEVGRIFTEGLENTLVPVANWATFADKGGLKGTVDFFPLKDVVEAIDTLGAQLQTRITLLYQVSGMSDIMRGQATSSGVTATEQKIKAQYGSIRIQNMQDEVGLFTQDLLNKKVWIIRKFYDPQKIVELSNIMHTPDAQFVPQALALIKSDQFGCRVIVQADSLAQVDKNALKAERAEYMQATAQFLGQAQGLVQMSPDAFPFVLRLLRFGLAAMPAADEIEGVIDQFASQVENKLKQAQSQPPQLSPEQIKAQQEQQKMQMEAQLAQQEAQQEAALNAQTAQREAQQAQAEFALEMQKLQAEIQADREKAALELQQSREEFALKLQEMQLKIDGAREMAQIKVEQANAMPEPASNQSGD